MKTGTLDLGKILNSRQHSTCREKRSVTTGRLLCKCGKGTLLKVKKGEHYGQCRLCWVKSLTRREIKEKALNTDFNFQLTVE